MSKRKEEITELLRDYDIGDFRVDGLDREIRRHTKGKVRKSGGRYVPKSKGSR